MKTLYHIFVSQCEAQTAESEGLVVVFVLDKASNTMHCIYLNEKALKSQLIKKQATVLDIDLSLNRVVRS